MSLSPAQLSLIFIGLLLCCGTVPAQKTWVVDAAGGTGSNYRDLPAAVQAAQAGDILVIRKGSYTPATITTGLRVFGKAGATIDTTRINSLKELPLRVDRLPAGQVCIVQGLSILGVRGFAVLELTDNSGSVVFRNLTIGYSAPAGDFALKVARSKAVHMTNCTVNMGASFVGSAAVIAGSTFSRKQATFPINSSRAAIDAMSSKLELVGVQATGQTGVFPFLQSRPALAAAASQIRILGDATSIYQAGAFQNSGLSNPALMGTNGSTLEIDPRVVLKPTGTASGHAGFSQVTIRQMSIFTTSGGNLGGSLVIDLRSRPQDPFVVALSLPATPVDLPPLGRAWVDPKTLVPLAFGTQGTTGQWRRVLPVPNTPALRGLPLLLQSLSGSTFVELTNPSLVVIH